MNSGWRWRAQQQRQARLGAPAHSQQEEELGQAVSPRQHLPKWHKSPAAVGVRQKRN